MRGETLIKYLSCLVLSCPNAHYAPLCIPIIPFGGFAHHRPTFSHIFLLFPVSFRGTVTLGYVTNSC